MDAKLLVHFNNDVQGNEVSPCLQSSQWVWKFSLPKSKLLKGHTSATVKRMYGNY